MAVREVASNLLRLRVWRVVLAIVVIFAMPALVLAAEPSPVKFSKADLDDYLARSRDLPACASANALDDHNYRSVDIKKAPLLATLYSKCHAELKSDHAPTGDLRVVNFMMGIQCLTISMDQKDLPVCDAP